MKKILSVAIITILVSLVGNVRPTCASTDAQRQARHTERVKTAIQKLGAGKESRIAVKLRDDSKLVGYVSEVNEDDFAITSSSNGAITRVKYPNVRQVKGQNLSTGAKIAIISLSIATGLLAFFLWLENYD